MPLHETWFSAKGTVHNKQKTHQTMCTMTILSQGYFRVEGGGGGGFGDGVGGAQKGEHCNSLFRFYSRVEQLHVIEGIHLSAVMYHQHQYCQCST